MASNGETRFVLQSFLFDTLTALFHIYRAPEGPVRLMFTIGTPRRQRRFPVGTLAARKDTSAMLLLPNTHEVDLSVTPTDVAGNPAQVQNPTWTVSDESILSITPSADGLSAVVTALGPLGSSQVNVTADADLGDGVRQLSAVLDVEVRASEAVALAITTGTPRPKTVAEPVV